MSLPLLTGTVDPGDLDRLRGENLRLTEDLKQARAEVEQSFRAVVAMAFLRRQLEPLHRGLQAIFGEMEAAGVEGNSAPGVAVDGVIPLVWQSWRQKFGETAPASKFIDALLQQGQLSAVQLRVYMKCGGQTVYNTALKLNRLGLLEKNGGKYSLRKI